MHKYVRAYMSILAKYEPNSYIQVKHITRRYLTCSTRRMTLPSSSFVSSETRLANERALRSSTACAGASPLSITDIEPTKFRLMAVWFSIEDLVCYSLSVISVLQIDQCYCITATLLSLHAFHLSHLLLSNPVSSIFIWNNTIHCSEDAITATTAMTINYVDSGGSTWLCLTRVNYHKQTQLACNQWESR